MKNAYDVMLKALGSNHNFDDAVKQAAFFLAETPDAAGNKSANIHRVDRKFKAHDQSKYLDYSTCAVCGKTHADVLVGIGGYETWYNAPSGKTICCFCVAALDRLAALSQPEIAILAKGEK